MKELDYLLFISLWSLCRNAKDLLFGGRLGYNWQRSWVTPGFEPWDGMQGIELRPIPGHIHSKHPIIVLLLWPCYCCFFFNSSLIIP